MRTTLWGMMVLIALGAGCGPKPSDPNMHGAAPHGGMAFIFDDKSGAVEIGTEPADTSLPGVSKQNSQQIFAYFFQADVSTPLASKPTDVSIIRGELPPIPLTSQELSDKAGRYASAPLPAPDELRGILEATIDGKKVQVPFTKR